MTSSVFHASDSRGKADFGWLNSRHTFSFGEYHNPERVHFGALRVINDDTVAPGMGFGEHPHRDMEIISIPLDGELEHRDNMGNSGVIRAGDIQVMSAGTGIFHSEYNHSKINAVKFLQIWVFPNQKGVKPRYDQKTLHQLNIKNKLHLILSPEPAKEAVWIHQNAWFYRGHFDADASVQHPLHHHENGVYVFIISGQARINDTELQARDGLGLKNLNELNLTALVPDTEILLMEVPV